ncbi:hypothetical protein D3C87_504660 [compost metagenome]
MIKKEVVVHHFEVDCGQPNEIQSYWMKELYKPNKNMSLIVKNNRLYIAAAVVNRVFHEDNRVDEIQQQEYSIVTVPTGNAIPHHKRAMLIGHHQMYVIDGVCCLTPPACSPDNAEQFAKRRRGFSVFLIEKKKKKKHR